MSKSAIILQPHQWSVPPGELIPPVFDNYFLVGTPEYREPAWSAAKCRALVTDHPGIAVRQLMLENQLKRHDLWVFNGESSFSIDWPAIETPFRAAAVSFCPVRDAGDARPVIASFHTTGAILFPWPTLRYTDFNHLPFRPGEDYLKTYTDAANRLGFSAYIAPVSDEKSANVNFADYIIANNLLGKERQLFHKSRLLNVIKRTPIEKDRSLALLVDLTHLRQGYNGTMEHARNLFLAMLRESGNTPFTSIKILGSPVNLEFHGISADLCLAPEDDSFFDLCLRPYQIDSPQAFVQDIFRARRLVTAQLDVIGCRCDYIYDSPARLIQKNAVEACDGLLFISDYGARDVRNLFELTPDDPPQRAIPLAMESTAPENPVVNSKPCFMVVGSWRYDHKMLRPLLAAIRTLSDTEHQVEFHFLGDLSGEPELPKCVRYSKHDTLPRELDRLFASMAGFIYPSVYEGFGLPIMHALRLGKPVLLADTEVNREIQGLVGGSEFHYYLQASDLPAAIGGFIKRTSQANIPAIRRVWDDVARETLAFLAECAYRRPSDTTLRRARREGLILCHELERKASRAGKSESARVNHSQGQGPRAENNPTSRLRAMLKSWLGTR